MKHETAYRGSILLAVLFSGLIASGQKTARESIGVSFSGQAIGWNTINPTAPFQTELGLRYIPKLSFRVPAKGFKVDGEFSANTWLSGRWQQGDSLHTKAQLSPYRMWIRFSWDQFELRAGLQKINFGSATMFRPLMWFDRIDPRDPLQLTDGVYGMLARYYFLNNANIWLWGLWGEEKTKGWEQLPTKKNSIEYGGRLQLPLHTGELAATYHHRTAAPGGLLPDSLAGKAAYPENRIALDAKIDLAFGLWAEAALVHQDLDFSALQYKMMMNVGMDYTLGLGNGIRLMAEFFRYHLGKRAFDSAQESSFGLLSLSYPLNIVHSITGMVFYDFRNRNTYRFVNWSMALDRWNFYVMAFWNPDSYTLYNADLQTSLYGGWGFQLMAVFTH